MKTFGCWLALAGLSLAAGCSTPPPQEEPGPATGQRAETPAPPAPSKPVAPPLPTLEGQGVIGTLSAKGKTTTLKHLRVRRITGMFDEVMNQKTEEVELILSEQPLLAETLKQDKWAFVGDYEGLYLRVEKDGTVRNLKFVRPDVGYQLSNSNLKEYAVDTDRARGRDAGTEQVGGGADAYFLTWAFAFDAKLPKGPPVKHK